MKQVLKPVRAGGLKNLLSDRVMSTESTDLVNVELRCVAEKSPDFMLPYHADLLYNISVQYTQAFSQLLSSFMAHYSSQYLTQATKQLIVTVLPMLSTGQYDNKLKFKAFLLDFASVCRGEKQMDILMPYGQLVGLVVG